MRYAYMTERGFPERINGWMKLVGEWKSLEIKFER